MNDSVIEIDKKPLSIKDINKKALKPYIPTIARCNNLLGSGVKSDDKVYFAIVMIGAVFNKYVILTTYQTFEQGRRELNNLTTALQSTFSADTVDIEIAEADAIVHFISLGMKQKAEEDTQSEFDTKQKSEAKRRFQSIVEQAVTIGAADMDFSVVNGVGSYAFKIDGKMTARYNIPEDQVRAMTGAIIQTETENMTGSIQDQQIIAKTTTITIEPIIKNKRVRQKVRLRGLKAYCNGGFTYSFRIILTRMQDSRTIDTLGLNRTQAEVLKWLSYQPNGIILIAGPTGHGKTVTLKTLYENMPSYWKLLVIEDPVEYIINHPNVTQEDIIPEYGLTASAYQKGSLRQFPNVIGISEIRDKDIATDVINSALSGHLMVSTIHTHDTLSTPERLSQLGVSYRTQALNGLFKAIISQRLLPKLCDCAKPGKPDNFWGDKYRTVNSEGCDKCRGGIKGRVLVGEILMFDSEVREYLKNDQLGELEKKLRARGWKSMLDYGVEKVREGLVDPNDLINILGDPHDTLESMWDYEKGQFCIGQTQQVESKE
jgi:type II secretory ATPase GspE/PulE/Tfp pilus assembly ATPase PilB-like protein